ncbi:alpha-1,2-fucosyltransferase [Solidesulfovibrio sp.]|uniref:alpha-1,2-fucosyltransferase n=1 Tax=Solidesulfovibrio sp. TaxID=2910990 RepID=UPI00261214F4|nr:alpha-1,2-fucosyltransferase [Solidesulfovibrio sp.]
MFQYAAGRALAAKFDAGLVLDILDYAHDTLRHYELNRLCVQCQIYTENAPKYLPRRPGRLQKLFVRLSGRRPRAVYWETGFSYNAAFETLRPPVYLDGYWQSERYFCDIADILRREFSPAALPSAANAALLERIRADAGAVSLHVRRGDYVSNPVTAAYHGACSLEYYRRAVDHVAGRVTAPHFYLFSDDPDWVRENLRLAHPCTVVDGNADDGAADMALMRACAHHVVANSSFSWWGAWLGENPEKIVVAPRHWFREPKDTRDLIPSQWIAL